MELDNIKIDQNLLDKYAAGHCSVEESLLVEKWLDSGSWESIDADGEEVDEEVGHAIWSAVKQEPIQKRRWTTLYIGVAASLLFLMGFGFYKYSADNLDAHTFTNTSLNQTKVYEEDYYAILLSSNSIASIDLINNKISFSGDFVLRPKRDFELLLGDNMVFFKGGREYFVTDSPVFGQAVALQKSDLAFLPPNMQLKIRAQFQDI